MRNLTHSALLRVQWRRMVPSRIKVKGEKVEVNKSHLSSYNVSNATNDVNKWVTIALLFGSFVYIFVAQVVAYFPLLLASPFASAILGTALR